MRRVATEFSCSRFDVKGFAAIEFRLGGCHEEFCSESATVPRVGRWPDRCGIRRYARLDRDCLSDRDSSDWNEREQHVQQYLKPIGRQLVSPSLESSY